jgi:hypothetical protein
MTIAAHSAVIKSLIQCLRQTGIIVALSKIYSFHEEIWVLNSMLTAES